MNEVQKYKNDKGQIAVLVSHGYGSGWSSWQGTHHIAFYAMDKTLIEMKLSNESEESVKEYCKQKIGDEPYMGGWSDCEIYYLEEGEAFNISEHDGNETLETFDRLALIA